MLVVVLAFDLGLGTALSLPQSSYRQRIEQAREAYWEGRFEESIELLEPLRRTVDDPRSRGQVDFVLGLDYLALNDLDRGRTHFESAAGHDPAFRPDPLLYSPDVVEAYESARHRIVGSTPVEEEAPRLVEGKGEQDRPPAPAEGPNTSRPPERFENIKLLVNEGDEAEETDAVLFLEEDRLVVLSEDEVPLKVIPYESVRSAEYSHSKHPRWKAGLGAAIAVGIFALPIFFLKGKKHWLTVQSEDDFAILRLDKRNYKLIQLTFEARSGLPVETVEEAR